MWKSNGNDLLFWAAMAAFAISAVLSAVDLWKLVS